MVKKLTAFSWIMVAGLSAFLALRRWPAFHHDITLREACTDD
jgi:hypothetical protein